MHLVIGMLALEYGLITEKVFIAVVCGAVASSIFLGPWLSRVVKRRIRVDVSRLMSENMILLALEGSDKGEVIEALCQKSSDVTGMAPDILKKAVFERERQMSTAVENGAAFPHGRVEGLKKPYVLFGRVPAGVEWNSPDGMRTKAVFLILTPLGDDDVQVQILRALAAVWSDRETASGLMSAKTAAQAAEILRRKSKELPL
jgi:PTS system nitrogen regulatory IIA component